MAAILFDLDGTLIDSAPDLCALGSRVLAAHGAAPLTLAETRGFIGNGAPAFVARMRAARALPDAEEPRMLEAFLAGYPQATGRTRAYPGVRDALRALAARGEALGLCTNKPEAATRAVLEHLDLARFFGVVIGGDSTCARKPDPAPLRAARAALPPGPALFVGDSAIDAETAARAGLPFALYTGGYRGEALPPHDGAFADWAALPDLARALAR